MSCRNDTAWTQGRIVFVLIVDFVHSCRHNHVYVTTMQSLRGLQQISNNFRYWKCFSRVATSPKSVKKVRRQEMRNTVSWYCLRKRGMRSIHHGYGLPRHQKGTRQMKHLQCHCGAVYGKLVGDYKSGSPIRSENLSIVATLIDRGYQCKNCEADVALLHEDGNWSIQQSGIWLSKVQQ